MTSPPEFRVEVDHAQNLARMSIEGQIDIATVPQLEQARDEALAPGPGGLLIDLSSVDFIDSSGLKFLLETHRLLANQDCTLMITRPADTAMSVFTLTRTDKHLPFFDADPS